MSSSSCFQRRKAIVEVKAKERAGGRRGIRRARTQPPRDRASHCAFLIVRTRRPQAITSRLFHWFRRRIHESKWTQLCTHVDIKLKFTPLTSSSFFFFLLLTGFGSVLTYPANIFFVSAGAVTCATVDLFFVELPKYPSTRDHV